MYTFFQTLEDDFLSGKFYLFHLNVSSCLYGSIRVEVPSPMSLRSSCYFSFQFHALFGHLSSPILPTRFFHLFLHLSYS